MALQLFKLATFSIRKDNAKFSFLKSLHIVCLRWNKVVYPRKARGSLYCKYGTFIIKLIWKENYYRLYEQNYFLDTTLFL